MVPSKKHSMPHRYQSCTLKPSPESPSSNSQNHFSPRANRLIPPIWQHKINHLRNRLPITPNNLYGAEFALGACDAIRNPAFLPLFSPF